MVVVRDVEADKGAVEKVPMVYEFPNIFPEELPGLPPDREIELYIDVVPSMDPIYMPPYKMAPA